MSKKTSKIIIFLLTLSVLMSLAMPAAAVSFEGVTGGGGYTPPEGSGSGGNGDGSFFEIVSYDVSHNIVAYRFTYVNADGTVYDANPLDGYSGLEIWIKNPHSWREYNNPKAGEWNVESLFPKLSKRQYVLGEQNKVHMNTIVRSSTSGGCDGSVRYDDVNYFMSTAGGYFVSELTYDHSKLEAWCREDANMDIIAKCLGKKKGIDGMGYGDKIIVEPVFLYGAGKPRSDNPAKLTKVWYAMTVSEMAQLATGYYGLPFSDRSNADDRGENDTRAFVYIGLYSNVLWPSSVYTPNGRGLWNDVIWGNYEWPPITNDSYNWEREKFRTWKEIMYDGFGVAIIYDTAKEVSDNSSYDVEAAGIKFYADEGHTQEIDFSKGDTVTWGQTVYTTMTYHNHSNRDVAIDAFVGSGYLKLPTDSGYALPVVANGIVTVSGGSFVVNFVGGNSLSTTVRIVENQLANPYTTYPGNANTDDTNGRFMNLYAEEGKNHEQIASNNTIRENIYAYYDVAITNIILSSASQWSDVTPENTYAELQEDGTTVTYRSIALGETVYVYHTYRNNALAAMNCTGYNNAGTPITYQGETSYAIPANGELTILAESFVASSENVTKEIQGSVYWSEDTGKIMAHESNRKNNVAVICPSAQYDVELTDIYLYSDADYTVMADPEYLMYGQTIYIGYAYTNNGSTSILVDGYNANDILIDPTAIGVALDAGETKVIRGGSFVVNWIGASSLDGTVRIVQDKTAQPYSNITEEPADGTRLLPLREEMNAENQKGNLGNNYKSIPLAAYYDVGITKITLRNTSGAVINPTSVPFGETINVYHTYHNYSGAALLVTGYRTDGSVIKSPGAYDYFSIPAGGEIEVLAETYVANSDNMVRELVGSVYKLYDEGKQMTWETDKTNNRMELTALSQYDLAITNIKFLNGSGKLIGQLDDDGNVVTPDGGPLEIYRGEKITVYHTYTTSTSSSIDVSGYVNGTMYLPKGAGSYFTLAGGLVENTVYVGTLDTTEIGDFTMKGSVYYKFTQSADKEINPYNNVAQISYSIIPGGPWLEPIEPNQAYREGTEVITSFYLHNDTPVEYTPDMKLKVRMWVLDADTGLPPAGEDGQPIVLWQSVVVPADETQLVYFRWKVPSMSGRNKRFVICCDYTLSPGLNGEWVGKVSEQFYKYTPWEITFTPDTEYEARQPNYWSRPSVGTWEDAVASWYEWEYIDGRFQKINYGVMFQPGITTAKPTAITAYKDKVTGNWTMKSGYGFTVETTNVVPYEVHGATLPDPNSYTLEQYCYALFPEFEYELNYQKDYELVCGTSTLEPKESGGFQLYEFCVKDKKGNDKNYGRVHWTPIWYPDGRYYVKVVQQDIWTPVGAVETTTISNSLQIEGNMYDDWYIGHGIT